MEDRFYYWRSYYDALAILPEDVTRGAFIRAMCEYAFDGREPDFGGDLTLEFAWRFVRDQIGECVEIGRRASERGRRGGRGNKRPKGKKSSALGTALSTDESTDESVRYSNVPTTDGAYVDTAAPPSGDMVDRFDSFMANMPKPPE